MKFDDELDSENPLTIEIYVVFRIIFYNGIGKYHLYFFVTLVLILGLCLINYTPTFRGCKIYKSSSYWSAK